MTTMTDTIRDPQIVARETLEAILQRPLSNHYNRCTGDAETCPLEECMLCSVRDCPGDEPLHYHHDGCPYCFQSHKVLEGGSR